MSIPKSAFTFQSFEDQFHREWGFLRDQIVVGQADGDRVIYESTDQQNASNDSTAKTLAEGTAKLYRAVRRIWGYIGTVQMFNRLLDTGIDITCDLTRQVTHPSQFLYQRIELLNKLLFQTPLFFLIRSNKTISDAKAGWDLVKATLTLAGRIKRGTVHSIDLMNLGANLLEVYIRVGLRRSAAPSQWADRNFYLQLQSFNDFVTFGLSVMPERVVEEESRPSPFNIKTSDINAFIEALNAQETVQPPLEVREQALRALLAEGITCDNLANLPLIPSRIYHDRVLSKYLCAITGWPVRFPVIIRVRGEIKLCERKHLEQWYGPITNCLPDSSRPNHTIPGLNCLPLEITILKRLDPQILKTVESRLSLLSNVLAQLEGRTVSLPAHDQEGIRTTVRNWVMLRLRQHASQTERLIELVDSVAATPIAASGHSYHYYYLLLARLCVIASYKTTSTYAWLENRLFKWLSINLFGADPNDLEALERKFSNLLQH